MMTPPIFAASRSASKVRKKALTSARADFRVDGRIFATLAAETQGYGNLMLSPEQQAAFVAEAPDIFLPVPGGWGRNGATHSYSAAPAKICCLGALQTAWKLRVEKNRTTPKAAARSFAGKRKHSA